MTFEIRLAQPPELPTIGEITVRAYTGDGLLPPDSEYVGVLRDADRRARMAELWVAAEQGGQVLGSVTFCPPGSAYRELAAAGEGEFRMLSVHPTARRRGVAHALVQRCIARSRELGDRRMVICSQHDMHTAHRLYRRFGFARLPERDWDPLPGIHLLAFSVDL
ncbi:MAG: GNAT family N-acetyltransferase [Nocardioidaceae bacterium]